jgi:hypothetical protein
MLQKTGFENFQALVKYFPINDILAGLLSGAAQKSNAIGFRVFRGP